MMLARLFVTRIVGRHDHTIRKLCAMRPIAGPLRRIPIAAAAENAYNPPVGNVRVGAQDLLHAVGRVRVVNVDADVARGNRNHPSGHSSSDFQSAAIASTSMSSASRRQRRRSRWPR